MSLYQLRLIRLSSVTCHLPGVKSKAIGQDFLPVSWYIRDKVNAGFSFKSYLYIITINAWISQKMIGTYRYHNIYTGLYGFSKGYHWKLETNQYVGFWHTVFDTGMYNVVIIFKHDDDILQFIVSKSLYSCVDVPIQKHFHKVLGTILLHNTMEICELVYKTFIGVAVVWIFRWSRKWATKISSGKIQYGVSSTTRWDEDI